VLLLALRLALFENDVGVYLDIEIDRLGCPRRDRD
jgi:hypothetical protein